MSRYVVALDPPAAISGRVQLELNEGAIQVDEGGIDWGEAAIKAFLAEARYGEGPSDFRIPNRSITLPLGLGMVNAGTIPEQLASQEKARRELSEKVALLQRQGGVLLRQREGGDPMYADIVNASLTIPDRYAETGGIEPGGSLKLECLPDFYGEELSLPIMEEAEQITGAIREAGYVPRQRNVFYEYIDN